MEESTSFTIIVVAFAILIAGVCVGVTVGVTKNNDNYHEERMKLREQRLEIVEVCQKELDTDLQDCVNDNVKLLEEATP